MLPVPVIEAESAAEVAIEAGAQVELSPNYASCGNASEGPLQVNYF